MGVKVHFPYCMMEDCSASKKQASPLYLGLDFSTQQVKSCESIRYREKAKNRLLIGRGAWLLP